MASVKDYIIYCMELLGRASTLKEDQKSRIEKNLIKVLMNEVPDAEPECDSSSVSAARSLWSDRMALAGSNELTLEVQDYIPFIQCKAKFQSPSFHVDQPIQLQVFLRADCPHPVSFNKLAVSLSNQVTTHFHDAVSTKRTFSQQRISMVVSLKLPLDGVFDLNPAVWFIRVLMINRGSRMIISRVPKISVQLSHQPPALNNEMYCISLTVQSQEEGVAKDVKLTAGLKPGQDANLGQTTHVTLDGSKEI
ncbi:Trafficking protein particle complex subunit 11 [Larimichthys crocea]|uniref:Uncharacterized protein n=1 Tax=Larimichthys crocea TaxID=215358 RepID=A0ACD3REJ3_LARCR|nr:Trafficking protein particle complex subunit 11 [Larimichthys crocea]